MEIAVVPCRDIGKWLDRVADFLLPAIDLTGGRYDLESVFETLLEGNAQLWLIWDGGLKGACVTQLNAYPAGKVFLTVLFLGGNGMNTFLEPLTQKLKTFAESKSADGIELHGRPGWQRALAPFGVTPTGLQTLEVQFVRTGSRRQRSESDHRADGKPI